MNYLTLICDLHQPTYTFTHTHAHTYTTHTSQVNTHLWFTHMHKDTHMHM